jgi:hypothetical protein
MGIKLGLFEWMLWNYLRCIVLCTARQILLNYIRGDEMRGACDSFWEKRNVYILMVGKDEGQRLVGTRRRSSGDDIKMDLRAVV